MRLPDRIAARLSESHRRRLFRRRLSAGRLDYLEPLVRHGDPFGEWPALFRAVDYMLANGQGESIPRLASLARNVDPFGQAIWEALRDWVSGDTTPGGDKLDKLGADDTLDGPHRDAANAWHLFLRLPSVKVGPPGTKGCMQFWDTPQAPADVASAMDTWQRCTRPDYAGFDDKSAAEFIRSTTSPTEERLFWSCPHPAIRCDFFRLCYILQKGGMYVDADTRMRPAFARIHGRIGNGTLLWFRTRNPLLTINNAVLSASPGSPFIAAAFERACANVARAGDLHVFDIAGPAMFTQLAVEMFKAGTLKDVTTATDHWIDANVMTQFGASYKTDERNWHLWQQMRR